MKQTKKYMMLMMIVLMNYGIVYSQDWNEYSNSKEKCNAPTRIQYKIINRSTINYEKCLKRTIEYQNILNELNSSLRDKNRQFILVNRDLSNLKLELDKEKELNSKKSILILGIEEQNIALEKEIKFLKRQKTWAYVKGVGVGVGIITVIYVVIKTTKVNEL